MTARRTFQRQITSVVVACATSVAALSLHAQDMPDPSMIHGRALPVGELAVGTVTVRVVREAIGNDVAGQRVTLTVAGATRTATTDAEGRAEFSGLTVGAQVRAETVVDGETLTSDEFTMPPAGGLRVILVAGIARAAERRQQQEAEALSAPPVRGVVVLGGETRILGEFQSDILRMFYTLDIVNSARTRVDIGGPFVLDLPEGAVSASLLEGSPKTASINGRRLTVEGPFNPGTTRVQLGFEAQYSGSDYTLNQTFPVAVQQWLVGVERVGSLALSSPQFQRSQEQATEDGTVFAVGSGQAVPAGSTMTLQLRNLPSHSKTAAYVALTLAFGVVVLGGWLAIRVDNSTPGIRATLLKRRETLLARLADLERVRRAGSLSDEKYLQRRERVVRDLEQVYGELEALEDPSGGGEGVAA
jgi:hypothetical protein